MMLCALLATLLADPCGTLFALDRVLRRRVSFWSTPVPFHFLLTVSCATPLPYDRTMHNHVLF